MYIKTCHKPLRIYLCFGKRVHQVYLSFFFLLFLLIFFNLFLFTIHLYFLPFPIVFILFLTTHNVNIYTVSPTRSYSYTVNFSDLILNFLYSFNKYVNWGLLVKSISFVCDVSDFLFMDYTSSLLLHGYTEIIPLSLLLWSILSFIIINYK